jgi:hypothetical protein
VPAAALQTPVDLSNYTAHLGRIEPAAAAVDEPAERAPQPAAGFAPQSLTVSRRPPLELSLPLASGGSIPTGASGEHGVDLESPLDVPAFLRRQS